jgi:rhomboid protease GluP
VLVGVNDDRCYNCGRRNPGMWGFAPVLRNLGRDLGFVPFTIGGCVIVYVLTLVASGGLTVTGAGSPLNFLGPSQQALLMFGASGAYPIFVEHRWWTVLSAAWLHGGLLHILFNMMFLRQIAPPTAELYGPGRTTIIYVISSITGFLLSSFVAIFLPNIDLGFIHIGGSLLTLGASASLCGLIGALLYYGHRTGSSLVRAEATRIIIMLAVIGLVMPGIDNYAHAGGVAGGYVMGMLLDPMKPERGDHMIIGMILLAASVASIVASVVTFI